MVHIIKLNIRKSKKTGKRYYRITIPIANHIFNEAGLDEKDDLKVEAEKGKLVISRKE
jgi:hypothetical protein